MRDRADGGRLQSMADRRAQLIDPQQAPARAGATGAKRMDRLGQRTVTRGQLRALVAELRSLGHEVSHDNHGGWHSWSTVDGKRVKRFTARYNGRDTYTIV